MRVLMRVVACAVRCVCLRVCCVLCALRAVCAAYVLRCVWVGCVCVCVLVRDLKDNGLGQVAGLTFAHQVFENVSPFYLAAFPTKCSPYLTTGVFY